MNGCLCGTGRTADRQEGRSQARGRWCFLWWGNSKADLGRLSVLKAESSEGLEIMTIAHNLWSWMLISPAGNQPNVELFLLFCICEHLFRERWRMFAHRRTHPRVFLPASSWSWSSQRPRVSLGGRHAAGQALGRLFVSQRHHQGRSKKRSSITQYVDRKTLNVN